MPRRKRNDQLTPLELEIMQVLWEGGRPRWPRRRNGWAAKLAYTTVQTMLNVLVRKGKASRTLVDRAYRYRAAIYARKGPRRDVARRRAAHLRRLRRGAGDEPRGNETVDAGDAEAAARDASRRNTMDRIAEASGDVRRQRRVAVGGDRADRNRGGATAAPRAGAIALPCSSR